MDTQCQYPSRRCFNTRSVKISGELHRFCIFHRWRANAAQRRWNLKRQQEGESSVSDAPDSPLVTPPKRRRSQKDPKESTKTPKPNKRSKTAAYNPVVLAPFSATVKCEDNLDLQMSDEDIVILQSLLLDADDERRWTRPVASVEVLPWWEPMFRTATTTSASAFIV